MTAYGLRTHYTLGGRYAVLTQDGADTQYAYRIQERSHPEELSETSQEAALRELRRLRAALIFRLSETDRLINIIEGINQ